MSSHLTETVEQTVQTPTRYKVVSLFKRKQGLSVEEFRHYYENNHTKLFTEYLAQPGIERYVRRYPTPIPNPISGKVIPAEYDVIMEVWFTDRQLYEDFISRKQLDGPGVDIIARDEENFLDRDSMSMNTVEEVDTKPLPRDPY